MTDVSLRTMTPEDYPQVYALWQSIHGFALRSVDDSREGIERFLRRNPSTSVVAVSAGSIVGSILCGHDGRRAGLYHVCVREDFRRRGIGKAMVDFCLEALKAERISKVTLVAFTRNGTGNTFWQGLGWTARPDLNTYDYTLVPDNLVRINP